MLLELARERKIKVKLNVFFSPSKMESELHVVLTIFFRKQSPTAKLISTYYVFMHLFR